MDTMLGFKEFIVEMATKQNAFSTNAKNAEGILIKNIQSGQSSEKHSPMDNSRAERIKSLIHETIKKKDASHPQFPLAVYDTSTSSPRTKLKISNYSSGRRVEDAIISSGGRHYLLDLKMGPRGTGANFSAKTVNSIYSGIEDRKKRYDEQKPNKELVSHKHPIASADKKSNNVKSLNTHFDNSSHEERERIVKVLLNHHERTPKDVTKYHITDDDSGTRIYDSDKTWQHFNNHFKPIRYSSDVSGNTKKIYAHNENGNKIHIASVGVKYNNKKRSDVLDYNVKHYLSQNLEKSYGYKPLAHLYH